MGACVGPVPEAENPRGADSRFRERGRSATAGRSCCTSSGVSCSWRDCSSFPPPWPGTWPTRSAWASGRCSRWPASASARSPWGGCYSKRRARSDGGQPLVRFAAAPRAAKRSDSPDRGSAMPHVALFLLGFAAAADDALPGITLPRESAAAARRLSEADALLETKQWPEAIGALQRILDDHGDDLV